MSSHVLCKFVLTFNMDLIYSKPRAVDVVISCKTCQVMYSIRLRGKAKMNLSVLPPILEIHVDIVSVEIADGSGA